MTRADSNIAATRVILVSALALLAGGCATTVHEPKPGDPNEFPLLVKFSDRKCPEEVILPPVESCHTSISGAVCREKGKRIIWVAVKGDSVPYQVDPDQQFTLAGVPAKKPSRDPCIQSSGGVLDCKIDLDAHGEYKYSVTAGECTLDPRIYVP
jgi:hypothetical protein